MGNRDLTRRDLLAVIDLLRMTYTAGGQQTFISNVVHGLPQVVASELTAYCEIDPVAQTSTNWLDRPEVNTPDGARIWEAHMLEMPVVRHYVRTHDGRALRVTDFVSDRQFRQTGVYYEHYRPKGVTHVLATWVPSRELAIGVGVHRSGRDYTERERQLVDLLRPHLIQGWRNARAVDEWRRHAAIARDLAQLHPDTIVVDASGRAVFTGDHARTRLQTCGEHRSGSRIPDAVVRWARHLTEERREGRLPTFSPLVLATRDGTRSVTIRPFAQASGILLIVGGGEPRNDGGKRVSSLTARESEVLRWVAEGKTNDDIAAILHIAPKTVEKHLEHIYAKLDVPNRAAAVAEAFAARTDRR